MRGKIICCMTIEKVLIRSDLMTKSVAVLLSCFVCPSLLDQCFPTAGPRPGTGPWHQLYRAARGKYFIVEIF
jgi:hypothetical protein